MIDVMHENRDPEQFGEVDALFELLMVLPMFEDVGKVDDHNIVLRNGLKGPYVIFHRDSNSEPIPEIFWIVCQINQKLRGQLYDRVPELKFLDSQYWKEIERELLRHDSGVYYPYVTSVATLAYYLRSYPSTKTKKEMLQQLVPEFGARSGAVQDFLAAAMLAAESDDPANAILELAPAA